MTDTSAASKGEDIKCGWLDRGTKYTKSWTKRFVTLDRPARCLKYAESDKKAPKGTILMKKITRTAEKNEALKPGNPDLFSFAVEGVDPDGKDMMWLLRCSDKDSFDEWYIEIRASIAAHGLMEPVHYGLPNRDPRCDLPLITVPVEHLFRFSLLDKAIMYYFAPVQLCKPPSSTDGAASLQFNEHVLVLCDKNNYLFNFAADVIRCFPVASLKAIHAGDKCIGLKLEHPQHDVLFKTDAPIAIIEILRRTFSVATGADVAVESSGKPPEEVVPMLSLRPHDGHTLQVSAPTPKQKLKHALDVYERQTGQSFVYGSAQNPAAPKEKNHHHKDEAAVDIEDPMAALLMKIGLKQYIVLMQRQHLDLDVLRCMEEGDLEGFGIKDAKHRQMILAAAQGQEVEPASYDGSDYEDDEEEEEFTEDDDIEGGGGGAPRNRRAASHISDDIPMPPRRPMIVLDDDFDDDLILPNQKKIELDDDDIILPKKQIILDDSDEDLPIAKSSISTAGGAGSPVTIGDDI